MPFYESFLEETIVTKKSKAFKNYAPSYTVDVVDSRDSEIQVHITKFYVRNSFKDLLAEVKGFKCEILLKVTFCKEIEKGKTKYLLLIYCSSNVQALIKDLDINGSLETSYQIVLASS